MKVEFGRQEEQHWEEETGGVGLGLDSRLQLATPHPVARLQLPLLLLHHPCQPDQCMVAPQSFP